MSLVGPEKRVAYRNITMLYLRWMIIISVLSKAKSNWCKDNFHWKGVTAQAIADCDILKPKMTVELGLLTNKPKCLRQVLVTSWINGKTGNVLARLGDVGDRNFVDFPNHVSESERCEAFSMRISASVYPDTHITTFTLNPTLCVGSAEHSFARKCSGKRNSVQNTNSSTTSMNQTNPDREIEKRDSGDQSKPSIPVIAGVSVGIVFIFITIIVLSVFFKKRNERKSKADNDFNTDENHVYGTYSRGSMEEGEYGDGDRVYAVDANDYYG